MIPFPLHQTNITNTIVDQILVVAILIHGKHAPKAYKVVTDVWRQGIATMGGSAIIWLKIPTTSPNDLVDCAEIHILIPAARIGL
jgi:hypothetical protein